MFVFPLGLSAMTRRFPVVTVLILIGTVGYSLLRLDEEGIEIKEYLNSEATKELFRARAELTLNNCSALRIDDDLCQRLNKAIDLKTSVHPLEYQDKIEQEVRGGRFKREISGASLQVLLEALFKDELWLDRANEFKHLPEYSKFLLAREAFKRDILQRHKSHARLSGLNFNLRSLVEAQLTHAGWLHLIGNMIFFLLLAIPVEERLGSLGLFAVYVVGGFFGLSLQILTYTDPTQSLLGASANVSAIAGAFLALFWNVKMRVWLSAFFIWNKVVLIPTRLFIPVFVVSHDIIGTLAKTGQVAHLAHLGGLFIGLAAGWFWTRQRPLNGGAIFPFEVQLLQAGRINNNSKAQLLNAHEVLFYHHDNHEAQDILLETLLGSEKSTWVDLSPVERKILKMHFSKIFNRHLTADVDTFCTWMSAIPSDWPLTELTTGLNLESLHAAIQEAEAKQQIELTVRLLRLLEAFSHSELSRQKIHQRILILQNRGISEQFVA